MKTILFSLYSTVLALWVGGMFIFTFIFTPSIFKSYSREMAGSIVGHLFPHYFLYNLILSGIALVLFLFLNVISVKWVYYITLMILLLAFIINLVTITTIHPKMKRLKAEIHSFDSAPNSLPAFHLFKKLHRISAALNLIVIMGGILLIVLSQYLNG